jgi:hypothetical protein
MGNTLFKKQIRQPIHTQEICAKIRKKKKSYNHTILLCWQYPTAGGESLNHQVIHMLWIIIVSSNLFR